MGGEKNLETPILLQKLHSAKLIHDFLLGLRSYEATNDFHIFLELFSLVKLPFSVSFYDLNFSRYGA